ncbi:MAG TPA: hypothetical protein ENN80_09575 [Candidatus Hydrogenedentes bacterium]|nr:hypothetical protein [Candidatus Hydrogenedentota bacterium]
MNRHAVFLALMAGLVAIAPLGGCARSALDTTGFAVVNNTTVDAPFEQTWQATKGVLREHEWDIYTRDKRGVFVAYSGKGRRALVLSKRTKHTITLDALSERQTRVTVETVDQVYGTTLLTYPGWHDRKTRDDSKALDLLEWVKAATAAPAA